MRGPKTVADRLRNVEQQIKEVRDENGVIYRRIMDAFQIWNCTLKKNCGAMCSLLLSYLPTYYETGRVNICFDVFICGRNWKELYCIRTDNMTYECNSACNNASTGPENLASRTRRLVISKTLAFSR
jgi:hypothetical protein